MAKSKKQKPEPEEQEEKTYEVIDKRKFKIGEDGEVEFSPEPEAKAEPQSPSEGSTTEPKKDRETTRTAANEKTSSRFEKENLAGEQGPTEKSEAELPPTPVDVYSLLNYFIGILSAQCWQWLGLMKNPVTGQLETDLEQAKVAIDTISALANQLEPKLSESEATELKDLLSNLRINFVQQKAKHA